MSDVLCKGLFDTHCHIDTACTVPGGGDVCRAAGRLLCGVEMTDWSMVADAAKGWPGTVPAYGVHPWRSAGATDEAFDCLEAMVAGNPDAWVGEIGLDGMRTAEAGEEVQTRVFRRQLRLAAAMGRRVNVHCVKAWDGLVESLDAEYLSGGRGRGFIVHSFAGPHQFVGSLAGRGAYFTVGPLAWRRGSRKQEERVRLLPLERVLVESDAFLAPGVDAVDDLLATLEWLSGVRNMDIGELGRIIEENARRLFADA